MEDCACLVQYNHREPLEEFSSVRENCSVIRDIIIPDQIWNDYMKAILNPKGRSLHQPIIFLSFINQHLLKITEPIHKFVLDRMRQGCTINPQYKKDLQESWFHKENEIERNDCANIFMSRIAEILLIDYLSKKGLEIEDYEAFVAEHDIVYKKNGKQFHSEIKYIGHEKDDFLNFIEAIEKGGSATTLSPYLPSNFLIFKIFEAAKQLYNSNQRKAVYIIISDMTWHRFQFIIEDQWFDWQVPKFFSQTKWSIFLSKKKKEKRFANIENELSHVISKLDEINIFHLTNDFILKEVLFVTMR